MSSTIRSLKPPSWLTEFRSFIMRGSVVDLAVGIIIGAAFTGVVNSLVKDVINPLLGLIVGGIDFSNVFLTLNGQHYATLADAQRSSTSSSSALRSSGWSRGSRRCICARKPRAGRRPKKYWRRFATS